MANLVEIVKSTRGKNPRSITFLGVGSYVPRTKTVTENYVEVVKPVLDENEEPVTDLVLEGAVTSIEDALSCVGGDTQKFLNQWAYGFNNAQFRAEADKDELDEAIASVNFTGTPEEIESKRDAFKRAIRALAKALDIELTKAAEVVVKNRKPEGSEAE